MRGALRVAATLTVVGLALAGDASALECPQATMEQRIDAADVVFAGTLAGVREVAGGYAYRFDVGQAVKGPVGTAIEIRAAQRLVDASDRPVEPGRDAGVLARRDGAAFVTDSCGLTDPGALLTAADEPRGGWIKILLGVGILGAVVAYSIGRLRRRRASDQPPAAR
jgi:hypothetical protein